MAQVTSGSFETNRYQGGTGQKGLKFEWSRTSTNLENNYSTIHWTLKGAGTGSTYHELRNAYLNINGTRVYTQPSGNKINLYVGTKVAEGDFDIPHESDGTKTFSADGGGGVYTSAVNCTGSGSWELVTIPRTTTQWSINGNTIGSTIEVTPIPESSSFTHTVIISCGNDSQTLGTNVTQSSPATATLKMAFCNQITNATSANATITLITYSNGNEIGRSAASYTIYVPNNVVPTQPSLTTSDTSNLLTSYGAYVQGKSDLRVQSNADGSYGSSISSYVVNIKDSNNNLLRQLNGSDVTLYDISYIGTLNIETIVTDTRNRQNSRTTQISVTGYGNPNISTFTAERRNNDSTVTITYGASITNINNANVNGKSFRIYKRQKGTSNWGDAIDTYSSGYTYNGTITTSCDENYGWEFLIQAQDSFTTTSNSNAEVGTAFELMNWKADGTAMAIGKVSEKSNTLEVALNTEINGLETINTPDNTWSGLRINAGPVGESSIVFYNYAKDKSYAFGYNTANNDKIGLYSFETGKNVFEIDKYGNMTTTGGIQNKSYYLTSGDANDYKSYTTCIAILNRSSSFLNVPVIDTNGDDVGFLNVYCWAGNTDWTTQEYIIIKGSGTYKYIRRKIPQGWSNWERIYKATTVWEGETNNTLSNLPYTLTVFDFIEIFYTDEVGRIGGSLRFKPTDNQSICLTLTETESGSIYIKSGHWHTNGTSLVRDNASFTQISHSNYTGGNNNTDWIHIRRIIGWN